MIGEALACMEEMRNVQKVWLGSLNGRDHSKDLRVDGRIVLK
jgi:hypothetical protein